MIGYTTCSLLGKEVYLYLYYYYYHYFYSEGLTSQCCEGILYNRIRPLSGIVPDFITPVVSDDEEEDNNKKGKRKKGITKKDDSHGEGFDVRFDDIYQLYQRNRANGDEKEETKSALSVASTDINPQGSFMPAIFNSQLSRSFVQRKPIEAVEKIQRVRQVLCQPKSQIEKNKQRNGESTIFSNDSAKKNYFPHHSNGLNADREVFDNPLRRVGNFAQPVRNQPSASTSSASASSSSASSSSSSSVFIQRKGVIANKKQNRKGGKLKDILYSGRTAAIIRDDSKSGSDDIYDERPSSDMTSSFYKNKTNHQTNNNNNNVHTNSNNKKKRFRKKFLSYLQSATRQREIKKVQPVSSNQRQMTLQEVMEKRRMSSHGNDERVPPLPQATNEPPSTQRTALRRTAPPPPAPPLEAPMMTSSTSFTPISRTTRRRAFKLHYQKKKKDGNDVSEGDVTTPPRSLLSQLKKSLSQKVGLTNKTDDEEAKEIHSSNKKGLRTLRRVVFNQSSPALRTNNQGDRRSSRVIPAASRAFHKDFSSSRPSIEYDADQAVIDSSYKNYLQLIKGKRSQQHPPSNNKQS